MKGERSSQTSFQPVFYIVKNQNHSPVNLQTRTKPFIAMHNIIIKKKKFTILQISYDLV